MFTVRLHAAIYNSHYNGFHEDFIPARSSEIVSELQSSPLECAKLVSF